MYKIPDAPWEIEQAPIESRGGSKTCWKIGPMVACIYDDWRQRENGFSEETIRDTAYAIRAVLELLMAVSSMQYELLDIVDDWHSWIWETPEGQELMSRLRRLINFPDAALDRVGGAE